MTLLPEDLLEWCYAYDLRVGDVIVWEPTEAVPGDTLDNLAAVTVVTREPFDYKVDVTIASNAMDVDDCARLHNTHNVRRLRAAYARYRDGWIIALHHGMWILERGGAATLYDGLTDGLSHFVPAIAEMTAKEEDHDYENSHRCDEA